MAQNADDTAVDDSAIVTEDDLRKLKYDDDGVEISGDESDTDEASDSTETEEESDDAGEDDGKTDDQAEDEDSEGEAKTSTADEDSEFVKEFPNIKGDNLVDYARNLEDTVRKSNNEGKRLADLVSSLQSQLATKASDSKPADTKTTPTEVDISNPVSLYAKQKMDEEIATAFTDFSKGFPQVNDASEYPKFVQAVAELSSTILSSQKRLASPRELYSKAAVILGWEPANAVDGTDKLKIALKNKAAISKSSGASIPKKVSKSKVTDAMIRVNRLMYPNKTDDEIRKELEEYVQ